MEAKEKAKQLIDNMLTAIVDNCEHDSYCERPECQRNGMTAINVDSLREKLLQV